MGTKKHLLVLFLLSVFLIFGSGCAVIHPQHRSKAGIHMSGKSKMSPGHKKKIIGKKSTKHYSPGHSKKHKSPAKKYKRK